MPVAEVTGRMRRTVRWSAMLAGLPGALGVVAGAPAVRAADPYDINVVLPLSGPAAFLGTAEQAALQRFERTAGDVGGRPVRFVFHDDQSSPQVAVQLATQIVGTKPAVVLGSAVVAMCNAMAPLMRRGPVMYCLSPGIYPAAGGYVFSSSNATKDLASAQLRFFSANGWKRIAVVTSTDASGQDAQRNIRDLLALPEFKDVQLVSETTFNPTDVSAAAQVQRMKAAEPQAVIAWSTGSAIGTLFKAIQDAGLTVPVATTDGNMTYAAMQRFAGILPSELYIPSPEWLPDATRGVPPEVERAKGTFFKAFEGAPARPDAASTFAWDPALITVSALKALGPEATADQVRDRLLKLTGLAGVNGVYDFVGHPQRGLDDSNVVVTRWDKGAGDWKIVSGPRGAP